MNLKGDQIEIIEKIGFGGMGEIYKARLIGESNFSKIVALKFVSEEDTSDEALKSLENEANRLSQLNYPGIVNVIGYRKIENKSFIIMEYVDGYSLKEINIRLQNKGIKPTQEFLYEFLKQSLLALNYAHSLTDKETGKKTPVIHCDLSPHNILIDNFGIVKILDFGISRILNETKDHTVSKSFSGKLNYASIETLEKNTYSISSDIYSLGVVVYELATCKTLFKSSDIISAIHERKDIKLENLNKLRADLNIELCKLIDKTLDPQYYLQNNTEALLEGLCEINLNTNPKIIQKELKKINTFKKSIDKTVTSIKNINQGRRIGRWHYLAITILLPFILIILYYSRTLSELPTIFAYIDGEKYDLSPPKIEYNDLAEVEKNKFNYFSCELICSDLVVTAGFYWMSNFVEKQENLIPKMNPSEVANVRYSMIKQKEKYFEMISKSCPDTSLCQDIRPEFRKIVDIIKKVSESKPKTFNEIKEKAKELQNYDIDSFYLSRLNKTPHTEAMGEYLLSLSDVVFNTEYIKTDVLTNFDIAKIPKQHFPKSSYDCRTFLEYFWWLEASKLDTTYKDKFAVLLAPKETTAKIFGTKFNEIHVNKITQNDPVFETGLCYYERNKDKMEFSRYWVPSIGKQKK